MSSNITLKNTIPSSNHRNAVVSLQTNIQSAGRPLLASEVPIHARRVLPKEDVGKYKDTIRFVSIPITSKSSVCTIDLPLYSEDENVIYWVNHSIKTQCHRKSTQDNLDTDALVPKSLTHTIPHSLLSSSIYSSLDSTKIKRIHDLQEDIKQELSKRRKYENYMESLHQYNEIKDISQSLFGKLAELEGGVTRDLYEKYGVDLDD